MTEYTFHKYSKIRQLGHDENKDIFADPNDDIVIQEKVDGANFRFMIRDGKVLFGSRTQALGYEDDDIGGNWKRCCEYIKQQVAEHKPQLQEHLIYYGECIVKHSIHYNFDDMPPFLGFDILNIDTGEFIGYPAVEEQFGFLGLPFVPVIEVKKAGEIKALTDADIPKSKFYGGPCEGLVFKNYNKQLMAKYVTTKFKEVNKKTFGGLKRFAENDDERIVAMYCTNPRIDKIIFKLIDEGEKLEMALMHKLPKRVLEDIYEEHWQDICFSSWSVNFRNVKKRVSTRCLHVLKQVMVNNTLNEVKE